MLSMADRFRKLQKVSLKTLTGNRAYTTATIAQSDGNNSSKKKKASLYSRISPLGNPNLKMVTELDDWIEKGNKVRFSELKQIIHDLRKRRRFHHALEVSEWTNKSGIGAFNSTDHAVQLDLIGKVHGFLEAENYFNNLNDEDKTDKTYGALLHCYVRQRQTERALAHFNTMKEKGFALSPITSNDIMGLYIRTNQFEKVHEMLNEMKKNGVSPDNLSYRMCINSYGYQMNIEGMENVLAEMEKDPNILMDWNTYAVIANCYIRGKLEEKAKNALKKAEKLLHEKDGLGYNHLISLHACLGNKSNVLRLWGLQKTVCKRLINRDYSNIVKSLVKLGEFEEAEKIFVEWRSSGNFYDFRVPYILVDGYLTKGLCDKAKVILDDLLTEGKSMTPDSWGKVAMEFLKKDDAESAISCMETAFSLPLERKEWKMESQVVESVLRGVLEKSSLENVESFVEKLKSFVAFDREMYHILIKGYINGGKEVDRVLKSMRADKIHEDEETKKIISMQQKKV